MIAMAYILSLQGFVEWQMALQTETQPFGTTYSARQANAEEDLEGHRFSVKLCRLERPIVQRFDQWGNQLAVGSTLHGYLLEFAGDVHNRGCNDQLAGALRWQRRPKLGRLLPHGGRWRRCTPNGGRSGRRGVLAVPPLPHSRTCE